jgi:hypothetical protein
VSYRLSVFGKCGAIAYRKIVDGAYLSGVRDQGTGTKSKDQAQKRAKTAFTSK